MRLIMVNEEHVDCIIINDCRKRYNVIFIHRGAEILVSARYNEFDIGVGDEYECGMLLDTIAYFVPKSFEKIIQDFEIFNGATCEFWSFDKAISQHTFTDNHEKDTYLQLGKELAEFEKQFEDRDNYGNFLYEHSGEEIQLKGNEEE